MNHKDNLLTLHRYFVWADRMRFHLDNVIKNKQKYSTPLYGIETFLYMSYWYASLYVVIEGFHELGLHDDALGRLVNSPNVDLLKRYRNGVFHFQKKYYDNRFIGYIEEGEDCVAWIRQLTEAFRIFFKKELAKRGDIKVSQ